MANGFGPVVLSAPSAGSAVAQGFSQGILNLTDLLKELAFMNLATKRRDAEFQREQQAKRSLVDLQLEAQRQLSREGDVADAARQKEELAFRREQLKAETERDRANRALTAKQLKQRDDELLGLKKSQAALAIAKFFPGVDPTSSNILPFAREFAETQDLASLQPISNALRSFTSLREQAESLKLKGEKAKVYKNIVDRYSSDPFEASNKLKNFVDTELSEINKRSFTPDPVFQRQTDPTRLLSSLPLPIPGAGLFENNPLNDPATINFLEQLRR